MLPLKLAFRFLKSGRGQTILIIIGIGVAISAQIFVGLLIDSLQKTLLDRTTGRTAHITIESATDNVIMKDWQNTIDIIRQTGLTKTISVSASSNAFVQKGTESAPILMRGLDSQAVNNIYKINSSIYEGSWNPTQNGVLVGKDLKEKLEFELGDNFSVQTTNGRSAIYKIAGFYDLGVADLNRTWVIGNLSNTQALFGFNKDVTDIEITINDLFQADTVAEQLESALNNDTLTISNWKTSNDQLLSGLQGQSISSLMIQIFIIVSVVIAIASILAITVFQKSRQIGILKAMGIKDRSASLIFIFEGLFIGLIGSIIGVALGLGLLYAFATFTTRPGTTAIVDLYIDYKFVLLSWGISVLASVLAALIPARRSLRLNPIDVIREG